MKPICLKKKGMSTQAWFSKLLWTFQVSDRRSQKIKGKKNVPCLKIISTVNRQFSPTPSAAFMNKQHFSIFSSTFPRTLHAETSAYDLLILMMSAISLYLISSVPSLCLVMYIPWPAQNTSDTARPDHAGPPPQPCPHDSSQKKSL